MTKIDRQLEAEQLPPHKLTLRKAIDAAKKDGRVSKLKGAQFSGWYQGAYWMVIAKQGGREVARVTVDDETGKVLDVRAPAP